MKFGKNRIHTQNKTLTIPIGIDGVGEEKHPIISYINIGNIQNKNSFEDRILSIVKGEIKKEEKQEKRTGLKLYLNTILKLLFNKKKTKITKEKLRNKIKSKIVNWWRKDITVDMFDLIKFVLIHGILSASIVISILTITKVDIPLVNLLRESKWLVIIYIIGFGSLYYLFLDLNKMLEETWRIKKK